MLRDIAILTGGEVISEELGLELKETQMSQLGRARQVKIEKENTMRIRTLLTLIFCALVATFVSLNWNELARTTVLNLGFSQTQGPLGLVMLGLLLLAIVVFGAYALAVQTTLLLETRAHAKEMKTQRELTDKAEISRFTELRNMIERIETDFQARTAQSQQLVQEQLHTLQRELRANIENSGNILAAYMGELEDRLERNASQAAATSGNSTSPIN